MENIDRDYECIDLLQKLTELNNIKSILVYDSHHPIKNYFVLQKQNKQNGFFSEVIKLKNIWIYYFVFCVLLILCTCFIIPILMILFWNLVSTLHMTSFVFEMFFCVLSYAYFFFILLIVGQNTKD